MRLGWLLMILCLLIGGVAGAQPVSRPGTLPEHPRQIWLISVHGFTMNDLRQTSLSHLQRLLKTSAVGGMNLKTGGKDTDPNSYATLGAGTRATAPEDTVFLHPEERADPAGPSGETAGEQYLQRMGRIPPGHSVIYPGIMTYIRENEASKYIVAPGALGESIRRSGGRTMVLGNLDKGAEPVRYAPFFTMDAWGVTEEGDIGKQTLKPDPSRPFGVKTRYGYLARRLFSWKGSGMVAVELGDLYRLHQMAEEMLPSRREAVKREILSEVDRFVGKVMAQMDRHRTLVLLAPTVTPHVRQEKEELMPVIIHRPGRPPGLLTSPTTRRKGIVSNIDLAPTLLRELGVSPPREMLGQPMKRMQGSLEEFWDAVDRIQSVYRLRPSVLYSFVLFQMAVLVIGLILLLRRWSWAGGWMQVALLTIMLTPSLFLLISGMTAESYWMFSLLLMSLGIGISLLIRRLDTPALFFWTGLANVIPLVIDGFLGGPLIQQSFLGYDPLKGARYYGIGNEYMGVLLGSSILVCAAWLERRDPEKRWVRMTVAVFFSGLVIFFAAPFLGTNAGGALASAVGFGVAYFRFFQTRWSRRLFLQIGGFFIGALFLLVLFNTLLSSGPPSHIGRALTYIQSGNPEEIIRIIARKLEMNLRLIRVSSWGKVFIMSLLAMTVLAFRPAGGLTLLKTRYPRLFEGFAAIVVGALAALAVNDSGIVSAATATLYVVMPVLIIGFREWLPEEKSTG